MHKQRVSLLALVRGISTRVLDKHIHPAHTSYDNYYAPNDSVCTE